MRIFTLVLILVTFTSCGLHSFFKIMDAMEQETVSPNSFKQEIPFRYEQGFIIVDVRISDKVFNFIFDTGASTILDDDIVESINYKKIGIQKHKGTTRKKQMLKVVKLDDVSFGDVHFSSIVASISDLDALKTQTCLKIDGILGANVMNKAVWQIDYVRKVMTLTSSKDSLNQLIEAHKIGFSSTGKGTPMLRLSLNGKYIGEGKLDTGSNGGIDLTEKDIGSVDSTNAFVVKKGISSGLFADRLETSKITIANNLVMGVDFELENTFVTFNKVLPYAIVGNKFLSNYLVTIDWHEQEISLSPSEKYKEFKYHTFGFTPTFKNGVIVIGSIYEKSSTDREGLKLEDQIVQINAVDLRNADHSNYCDLLNNPSWKSKSEILIVVKRDGKEIKRLLKKEDLFLN